MSDNKLLRKIKSEIAFHSEGTFLNDQNTTKTFRECHAEITRLLAVEVAAKEICNGPNWDKVCNCPRIFQDRATLKTVGHEIGCPRFSH